MDIADSDIGGARVRRTFTRRGAQVLPNTNLTADEVLSIPIANRRAFVDAGYLEIYPKSAPAKRANEARFVIKVGPDEFDVIVGHKLNDKPLARAEADRLAGRGNK